MPHMKRGFAAALIAITLVWGPRVRAADTTDIEAPAGTIAVFRLAGELREAPPQLDFGFDEDRVTLYQLLNRLNKAKKDAKIKAVMLLFDEPMIGWAQRQEIRQAIQALKAADKDVYCLLEEESQGTYAMACGASRVYMAPTGELNLIGLHIEQAYLKGLLDKVHVQADLEHMGAYKGAGEPFTRTGPSDEAKEMLDWLIKDLFEQMVQQIAEDRHLQPEEVKALIDRGPFNPKEALEAKLIDEIAYPEQVVKSFQERYGKKVELVHNYGARKLPEVDFSSPFAIFKLFGEMMSKSKGAAKSQIAVVYIDGLIVPGKTEDDFFGDGGIVGSTTMRRLLARIRQDDAVKAVVLRVSSPGGSALASDIIWNATKELGDEKPLIVSMGDVAASGGYYVSVSGATIFADPGTITGSIGVLGGKLVTVGLWNWLGVTFHESSLGRNADLFNTNRPFDDRQRAIVRKYMKEVYDVFKERVVAGRKDRLKDEIEELAGGRVYTGRQALAKGLVDQLGGLQDAIKFAASEAKVGNYDVVEFPEAKNFFEMLFKSLAGEEDKDQGDSVQIRHRGWLLTMPAVTELTRVLSKVDPAKSRMVLEMLLRLEMLSRESTLLVTPSVLLIR
ncbi:MAG: signal peptide peptidase SppA [Planctomycetes bacterium]|nr:signal peptide peptidase SppA [Planctomycetota bacterium]